MFGVVDVTVLAISVACGIGAIATLVIASRSETAIESQGQRDTVLMKLDEWRHAGLLVMNDKDYQYAIYLGKRDPEQLEGLVGFVQRIMDEELGPNDRLTLTATVGYEEEPRTITKPATPIGHLELITAFS
jgi:hypothetical protein